MPDTRTETLDAGAVDRTFTVTRRFDAPPALVWRTWTQPEHVVRWWGPGLPVTDCHIDLTVGGVFRLSIQAPDGVAHACRGVFRDIVEPVRLVLDGDPDALDDCGAGMPPRSVITVTFEEEDGGTRLTIQTVFDTAAAMQAAIDHGYETGWPASFDRLAALAAEMGDHSIF